MADRSTLWQRADSAEFPELPDSAVTLWHDDAARYPEVPRSVEMVRDRHGRRSDVARWAPELRGHEAPMVSWDGRGDLD